MSSVGSTQVLDFSTEEGPEAIEALEGYDLTLPTLDAFVLPASKELCQVTKRGISTSDGQRHWRDEWKEVTLAVHEGDLVALATVGGKIALVSLMQGKLQTIR